MATITFYKAQKLEYDNNYMFMSDIGLTSEKKRHEYLESGSKYTIQTNLSPSWIKNINNLTNTITILLEGRTPNLEYNYIKIIQDEFDYFYFITGYEELGANQVRYSIALDTLNTFAADPDLGINLRASPGIILKEHKNRFSDKVGTSLTPSYDRNIEEFGYDNKVYNELYKRETDRTRLVLKQYGGGVKDQEVLSKPIFLWEAFGSSNNPIASNEFLSFQLDFGWSFLVGNDTSFKIKFGDSVATFTDLSLFDSAKKIRVIRNPSSPESEELYYFELASISGVFPLVPNSIVGNFVQSGTRIYIQNNSIDKPIVELGHRFITNNLIIDYDTGMKSQTEGWEYGKRLMIINRETLMKPINKINLFDSKITKVIELPFKIKPSNSRYYYPVLFDIKFLDNLNIPAQAKIYNYGGITDIRKRNFDPKLYTSQFNPLFITFMGEGITIKRELLNGLKQVMTYNHALNLADYSKIALRLRNETNYVYEEPFQFDRTLDMNNEVTTVGSELKSYLDNTYSNDLKLMQLQEAQATRNLQKQAVSIATNVALGAAAGMLMGNPGAAVVGGASGAIKGGIDYAYASAQAIDDKKTRQLEYENKLINMQTSLINVVGGTPEMKHINDADTIRLYEVKPIDIELSYIDDQFHYYGYKTLEYAAPTFYIRRNFDYKQIIFRELYTTRHLTREVKADILRRFSEGVTTFYINNVVPLWDVNQIYENWERELI